MHPVPQQQICCMLRGLGLPTLKRAHMGELQTPRPPKKPTSEPAAVIQAPKKPDFYLWVKWNYLFHVQMASLMETLVSEMVKRREAEERMVAALERLMRWIEVTDSELDGEELEKSEVGEGKE